MYAFHMVPEVPLAWKSISCNGPLASLDCAKVRFVSVAVGFTLMSKQACCGGEPQVLTGILPAPVRFQMGINEFASSLFSSRSVTYIEAVMTHS